LRESQIGIFANCAVASGMRPVRRKPEDEGTKNMNSVLPESLQNPDKFFGHPL
jgi:hypothetical protein